MKTKVKSSKVDLEYVKELLESGLSNVQIGLIIGRHSSTVGDYRDKLGLDINVQDNERITAKQVQSLYQQGMKQIDIAKRLGISRQRVSKILK